MRLTPDERRESVRERVLQALIACEGWLWVSMLHRGAFGGDVVTAAERDEALRDLEAAQIIERREVAKTVGRFGRPTFQYRYRAVDTAPSLECCDAEQVTLHIVDRLALLDLAMGILTLLADTA